MMPLKTGPGGAAKSRFPARPDRGQGGERERPDKPAPHDRQPVCGAGLRKPPPGENSAYRAIRQAAGPPRGGRAEMQQDGIGKNTGRKLIRQVSRGWPFICRPAATAGSGGRAPYHGKGADPPGPGATAVRSVWLP